MNTLEIGTGLNTGNQRPLDTSIYYMEMTKDHINEILKDSKQNGIKYTLHSQDNTYTIELGELYKNRRKLNNEEKESFEHILTQEKITLVVK